MSPHSLNKFKYELSIHCRAPSKKFSHVTPFIACN